jgi:DeoR family transcriptional regulator, fructose operon transcriptional repressor
MFAEDRQKKLLDLLGRRGRLKICDIETALGASPATVRRDLTELAQEGLVVRTHGGVLHPSVLRGEPVFQQRIKTAVKAKEAIAREAAALVGKNQTVYLDAGSTSLAVGKLLVARTDINIFTNSVPVCALGCSDGAKIHLVGGEYRIPSQSLTGAQGLQWLDHLRVDIAFIGASGLHEKEGASTTSLEEAAMKQSAMACARRIILLCDGTKWNVTSTIQFAEWSLFDLWITNAKLSKSDRDALNIAVKTVKT